MYRYLAWAGVLLLSFSSAVSTAAEAGEHRDKRALEVLEQMSSFKASLEAFRITGTSSRDVRLNAGLMMAVTEQVDVLLQRPGSINYSSFDGREYRRLILADGQLALSDSETATYATATVPKELDEALDVALDVYEIDLPLMDLMHKNVAERLLSSNDAVYYLGDRQRVGGVDCHQIAIRTEDVDVQLWVAQEGDPLPRKLVITDKWEGGAPRFVGRLQWDTSPDIPDGTFQFVPDEGAARIQFINTIADE